MERLDDFLKAHSIRPQHLADEAGESHDYLHQLRMGTAEPALSMMIALAKAAGRILGRKVAVTEMFDLGDEERTD